MFPPPPVLLSPATRLSLGVDLGTTEAAGAGSATWPTIRKIFYIPFFMETKASVVKIWWLNGATASGNVLAGIYRSVSGLPTTQLAAITSTAQGTINVVQEVALSTVLSPGRYFMALSMDNTTGTMFRWAVSGGSGIGQQPTAMGCASETPGTFILPTTATPVTVGSSFIPVFGLAFRSVVA